MKIIPTTRFFDSYKQGSIHATKEQIVEVLGFEPNVEDDPDKVVNSWGFTLDGEVAAIWDYKGSELRNEYSYFNPKVPELFNRPVAKQTTHLVGARRINNSKTLMFIPFVGGNIVLFSK